MTDQSSSGYLAHMKTIPKNTQEGIAKAISAAATQINGFIAKGWTREKAIAEVRSASTLGPLAWERVVADANAIHRA